LPCSFCTPWSSPTCSSRIIKKNGLTANAKQRYRCKDCGLQFITDYSYLGRLEAIRSLVVPLTLNGCGIRDTARVLLISPATVLKILRAAAAQVSEPEPPDRIRDLELDEFWSFVGSKKSPRWTWYGLDRQRPQVVAFVQGRRTDESGRVLKSKLGRVWVRAYRTDQWPTYARFFPRRRHHTSKEGTCRIERNHLNFRTRVKRRQRRPICYSRSADMHDAVIKLYVHHFNAQQHQL